MNLLKIHKQVKNLYNLTPLFPIVCRFYRHKTFSQTAGTHLQYMYRRIIRKIVTFVGTIALVVKEVPAMLGE